MTTKDINQTKKKPRTRDKLLNAALQLVAEGKGGLAELSLREITRRSDVSPPAFYGHFSDTEELGLVLVEDAMLTLRRMLREVRKLHSLENIIDESISVFLDYAHTHRATFILIARERTGTSPRIRAAIRRELANFTNELADDLKVLQVFPGLSSAETHRLAAIGITLVVDTVPDLLDIPEGDAEAVSSLLNELTAKLHMLSLSVQKLRD